MKKVLVVGGCGYIGGCLTDMFIGSENHEVTVYDALLYERRFLKKVKFVYGDIRDTKKLGGMINQYDVVVWLAALVGDGACAVNVENTKKINTDTVKWLVDNYKKKIIFTSTCSVYGVNHVLIDEEAEPSPLSVYASTKLEAEQYIINNHGDYLIYRLGTLFGLGDQHSRVRLDLVVNILSKKASEGQALSVFGGEQWRPLLHVKDVARAIYYGLEHDIRGLFNLSYGNFKIFEIAEAIQKEISSVKIDYQEMSFEDLRNYQVSTNKIAKTGWKAAFTLADGVRELLSLFSENRITNLSDTIYSNAAHIKVISDVFSVEIAQGEKV